MCFNSVECEKLLWEDYVMCTWVVVVVIVMGYKQKADLNVCLHKILKEKLNHQKCVQLCVL